MNSQRAHSVVLLDRDGTIVVDRDYLRDPAALEFLPRAAEGLRRLHERGHRLVVISNQSGVGRGLLSAARLEQINQRLLQMVRDAGAQLAGIYCCPHRPDEHCACRKPERKLVDDAAREHGFDPEEAIVIGDKASDIALGRRVGARTILIAAGAQGAPAESADACAGMSGTDPKPDHIAADLMQAAGIIEQLRAAPICS